MDQPGTNLSLMEDARILDEAAEHFGALKPDGTPNRSAAARAVLRAWKRDKDINLRIAQFLDSLQTSPQPKRAARKPAANRRTVTA